MTHSEKGPPSIPLDPNIKRRITPLIEEALQWDWTHYREQRLANRRQQQAVFQSIWDADVPSYISPSTAAHCLRWVGYEALGEQLGLKPAVPSVKSLLVSLIGTAAHAALLRKLDQISPGRQESSFTIDEADISGRIDFLLKNPNLGKYQVIELKFVGDYPFRQVKRDGVPESLHHSPWAYSPTPEYRKQVLQYMWSKTKQGLDIDSATIVYVNRNTGEIKEALVIWDAGSLYETEQFIDQIRAARQTIEKNSLPAATVVSPYVCAQFCPFRLHCEYGQKFVAAKLKKERSRKPRWVYQKMKKEMAAREQKAAQSGVVQSRLPLFEKF